MTTRTDTGLLDGFIDRATLADQLGCTARTIIRYENQPDGLPNLMLGGRKLYRIEAVKAWLANRERKPNPRRAH
jgi:phage terminase Nu1 subunit (DNA packaging protein)